MEGYVVKVWVGGQIAAADGVIPADVCGAC